MKKKVLLTGGNGQLGTYLQRIAPEFSDQINLVALSREKLDLAELGSIYEVIKNYHPDVVINTAAYTAVDQAEKERDLAMLINGDAVGEIAKACNDIGASLIQISTDYVFNGQKNGAYLPDDPTDPINYYGETKLKGEQLALKHCSRAVIVRTSWVYSEVGKNFKLTMLNLFQKLETIKVIDDQTGRPTHACDLARHCLQLAQKAPLESKTTHFASPEIMTWYDFANKLLQEVQKPVTKKIIPIPTSEYPTPAKRP